MTDFAEKYINPRVFDQLFELAEIAKFTPEQVRSYEDSLKYYRDMKNSMDTAKEEGREEGREVGRGERETEIVLNALKKGYSIEDIIELTGLSIAQIEAIRNRYFN